MAKTEASRERVQEPKEILVRIRMECGIEGGSNYYYHADVLVGSEEEALLAAQEGRIRNWRCIDSFDTSDKNYRVYESFGEIDLSQGSDIQKPLSREQKKAQEEKAERQKAVRGH